MIDVYGIANCDIVRKSTNWLKEKGVAYRFHNLKTESISKAKVLEWINIAGLDLVINKRSTTWRNLSIEVQEQMADPVTAAGIAIKETSIIKRPIISSGTKLIIGFDEHEYKTLLKT